MLRRFLKITIEVTERTGGGRLLQREGAQVQNCPEVGVTLDPRDQQRDSFVLSP